MKNLILCITIVFLFAVGANAGTGDNTTETATIIDLGIEYQGDLEALNDFNYYRFDLQKNGAITVDFSQEIVDAGSSKWTLELLLADDLSSIFSKQLPITKRSLTVHEGLSAGSYYILIKGEFFGSGGWRAPTDPYFLKVDYEASEMYEKTPNHNPKTADPLVLNEGYGGWLSMGNDYDYYEFTIKNDANVTVSLTQDDSDTDNLIWHVDLFSEEDLSAKIHHVLLNTSELEVSFQQELTAGKYYIVIHGYAAGSAGWFAPSDQYYLKVFVDNSDLCPQEQTSEFYR